MKIYEAHRFSEDMRDQMTIRRFKNVHYAMDQMNKHAGKYVEWKQMGEYHWAGRMSADRHEDFYIVYILEVE